MVTRCGILALITTSKVLHTNVPFNVLAGGETLTALLPHALVQHPLSLCTSGFSRGAKVLGKVNTLILSGWHAPKCACICRSQACWWGRGSSPWRWATTCPARCTRTWACPWWCARSVGGHPRRLGAAREPHEHHGGHAVVHGVRVLAGTGPPLATVYGRWHINAEWGSSPP